MEDKKCAGNILYLRFIFVLLQPKEFFNWLCKLQQDTTSCIFLIRNLFF